MSLYILGLSATHSFGFHRRRLPTRTLIAAGVTAGLLRDTTNFARWSEILTRHGS
ncbi:hypothetical protein ACFWZ2_13405 [Streptomyces sp. NPDC059002]|uniref:hypothetical protein n=1 Tax=Streptomyces sp. NPDC059002 TaxID=3346690 RepID=UPI0036988D3A